LLDTNYLIIFRFSLSLPLRPLLAFDAPLPLIAHSQADTSRITPASCAARHAPAAFHIGFSLAAAISSIFTAISLSFSPAAPCRRHFASRISQASLSPGWLFSALFSAVSPAFRF
jgi:hypothetical protein